jgi:hypothetical protein
LRRAHTTVVLVGRTQRPEQKELDVMRIPLILGVFVSLICAGIGTAADGPAGRPDGRLLPDGADINSTPPASRPDDRGDRFTPDASSELFVPGVTDFGRGAAQTSEYVPGATDFPAVATGRPDGRTVPDAVDARNAGPPVVIRIDEGGTTSFDWLAALIGGLAVGGLALATGGLLVLRHHGPTPAR